MNNNSDSFLIRPLLVLALIWALPAFGATASKTTLLVRLEDKPGWLDMAYLASVPASEMANASGGSLIALEPSVNIGPEIRDYMRRYKPGSIYLLGDTETSAATIKLPENRAAKLTKLPATSAKDAARRLS